MGVLVQHVRSLCNDLIAQNHQLTVSYAPHRVDEVFKRFVVDQQNVIRFVPLRVKRQNSPVADLQAIVQLLRLIKLEGPLGVVHQHSPERGAVSPPR